MKKQNMILRILLFIFDIAFILFLLLLFYMHFSIMILMDGTPPAELSELKAYIKYSLVLLIVTFLYLRFLMGKIPYRKYKIAIISSVKLFFLMIEASMLIYVFTHKVTLETYFYFTREITNVLILIYCIYLFLHYRKIEKSLNLK
jgi:hypothetical protein